MSKFAEEGINFTITCRNEIFVFKVGCMFCPRFSIDPSSTKSWETNVEQHVSPTEPNSKTNQKGSNHFSNKQQFTGQSSLLGFAFTLSSSVVNLEVFEDSHRARLCLGFPIEKDSIEEDLLFNLPFRDSLEFVPVFRPRPISLLAKAGTNAQHKIVGHAFRHAHCSEISPFSDRPFPDHICTFCKNIVFLRQFKREIEKRSGGIKKKRAYVDDHNDNVMERMKELVKSNTAMRRILLRNAKRDARPPPTLSKTLKVRF